MNILIIATGPRKGHSGYKHRVLQMARELSEQSHRVTLLWFFPIYDLFRRHDLRRLGRFGLISFPALPFYFNRVVSRMATAICRMITRTVLRFRSFDVVQAETPLAAVLIGRTDAKVVVDLHGDGMAEMLLAAAPAWKLSLEETQWEEAISRADGIVAVSEKLLQTTLQRQAHPRFQTGAIVPCTVDVPLFASQVASRAAVRRELGFEERIVFCYVGGMDQWQCIDEMLAIVSRLRAADSRISLLLITQAETAPHEPALRKLGDRGRDVICRSASHQEVARILPAADIGLLLRAQDMTNTVSSPTKFGEYLAAGVPVLTTEHAGDAPEIVKRENCGLVLRDPVAKADEIVRIHALLQDIVSARDAWSTRCRSTAAGCRGREISGCALRRLYFELNSDMIAPGALAAAE